MDGFVLTYDHYDPEAEKLREAITSTGNGYFCTRGTAEWEDIGEFHYPGTYTHGGYNRETSIFDGHPVLNEDLVNLPNWLPLKLRVEGEGAVRFGDVEVLGYRHTYDIRLALVQRDLRFRDAAGRVTSLRSRRFVSMAHSHQAAIEWTLTPENWSGRVEVVSALDGRMSNHIVVRYRDLEGRHLDPVSPRTFGPDVIALEVKTRQSNLYIAQAARTRAFHGDRPAATERRLHQMADYIQEVLSFDVEEGRPSRVEKLVSMFTSHDNAITEPLAAAGRHVLRYPDFAGALDKHESAWTELWESCDVRLPAEPRAQLLLRLHIAHVLQVCSRHTARHDAGVPARGLNGEAYRGHVFWDEMYVYPYLNLRLPEITRALLLYRHRRLTEARAAAAEAGYRGAMFPWQSGSDGTEETQQLHLNPMSGEWDPDLSHHQRHVNAAIFYNVWRYFQATDDLEFLRDYGAELMLEIARFWASIAHFDPARQRYEIHGVMGPDEFHERYPDTEEPGLRDNAYTNAMAAWIAATAPKVLDLLPSSRSASIRRSLQVTDEELATWEDMSRRMYIPFHDGVISQFEGYGDLEELDWDHYRARYHNVQRMDRILRAEGKDPNRYKLSKQADTVMLFFLFDEQEQRELFGRLGYDYDADLVKRTIEYYDARTTHGSTLSFVTYAGVLAAIDPESSWERYLAALESDVNDVQGGTTQEGIHMGVMSGTLDLLQRCYVGTSITGDVLRLSPRLVDRLDGVSFSMRFRGTTLRLSIEGDQLILFTQAEGFRGPLHAGVGDDVRELVPGGTCVFTIPGGAPARERGRTMPAAGFQGAIFDVDGVLVDSPHQRAWKDALRELMEGEWADVRDRTTWSDDRFTPEVYQRVISGKPRMSGALAALQYFEVPDAERRVEQYAAHKQRIVVRLIDAGEFTAYPDALRFALAVRAAGIPSAVASSSKNADLFLRRIRLDTFAAEQGLSYDFIRRGQTLADFFDADLSGRDFEHGKPDPEIFVTAAAELHVPPEDCFVVEDAVSGVQAAKAGGMAGLGVARADDARILAGAHADLVVTSLDEVDLGALAAHRLDRRPA
ncbi:HAD-IA family hydrolase [Nonomuraea sp. NPDC049486]|uniref:HAD-IA family hydrolase n=1 Tax=Nonomuraea sp. NPDC049486 TaxID=3155773 RepID=UPI003414D4A4